MFEEENTPPPFPPLDSSTVERLDSSVRARRARSGGINLGPHRYDKVLYSQNGVVIFLHCILQGILITPLNVFITPTGKASLWKLLQITPLHFPMFPTHVCPKIPEPCLHKTFVLLMYDASPPE